MTLKEKAEVFAVKHEQATLNIERIKSAYLAGAREALRIAAEEVESHKLAHKTYEGDLPSYILALAAEEK